MHSLYLFGFDSSKVWLNAEIEFGRIKKEYLNKTMFAYGIIALFAFIFYFRRMIK